METSGNRQDRRCDADENERRHRGTFYKSTVCVVNTGVKVVLIFMSYFRDTLRHHDALKNSSNQRHVTDNSDTGRNVMQYHNLGCI